MTNVEFKRDGSKLTIVVDLAQDHGPSATGKSLKIASTDGNVKLEGTEFSVGLNVYKPNPEHKKGK